MAFQKQRLDEVLASRLLVDGDGVVRVGALEQGEPKAAPTAGPGEPEHPPGAGDDLRPFDIFTVWVYAGPGRRAA